MDFSILAIRKHIGNEGILRAEWGWYSDRDPYLSAYRWMARVMKMRGIMGEENPPIWAWHSCGGYENPPTLKDARALLSDVAIESGLMTVVMGCPTEKVLLSNYGIWNEVVNRFIKHN